MSGCEKCGHEHLNYKGKPGCTGHVLERDINGRKILGTDRPCRKPRLTGADICTSHGLTKAGKAAAKRKITEQKAAKIMQTYGRPIETTATEALLDEVKWTAGYVAWLRDRVGELDEAALIWGKTKTVEQHSGEFPGTDRTEEAKPHLYRQMLLEERQHLVKVCAAAISAGIEERKVRLAEQQGALVADVIQKITGGILDALVAAGLTADLAKVFGQALATEAPRHLRLLTG